MNRPIIATNPSEWREIVAHWLHQIETNTIPAGGFPIAGITHLVCKAHLKNIINYRAKRIERMLAYGRYMDALQMYEPHWRLPAVNQLREKSDRLGVHGYWKLVRAMWDSLIEIWPFESALTAILSDVDERELLMSVSERSRLNSLPDEVVIYRGVGRKWPRSGLSWTLSPLVAEEFSRHYQGKRYLTATVNKSDIAALINLDGQFEIVMAAAPRIYASALIEEEE